MAICPLKRKQGGLSGCEVLLGGSHYQRSAPPGIGTWRTIRLSWGGVERPNLVGEYMWYSSSSSRYSLKYSLQYSSKHRWELPRRLQRYPARPLNEKCWNHQIRILPLLSLSWSHQLRSQGTQSLWKSAKWYLEWKVRHWSNCWPSRMHIPATPSSTPQICSWLPLQTVGSTPRLRQQSRRNYYSKFYQIAFLTD